MIPPAGPNTFVCPMCCEVLRTNAKRHIRRCSVSSGTSTERREWLAELIKRNRFFVREDKLVAALQEGISPTEAILLRVIIARLGGILVNKMCQVPK